MGKFSLPDDSGDGRSGGRQDIGIYHIVALKDVVRLEGMGKFTNLKVSRGHEHGA